MASLGSSMGSAAKYRLGTAVLSLGVDNRRFDAQMMRAQGRVQRFAGAASQAGFAASQAVAAPILLIGAMAVKVAAEYDQTMQHVKAVSGSTATEFQALTAQTQSLAETTRFTMKQVGDAQVFLAMAGMDTMKILRAMPEILNLATASGLQLARVSDLVTNIMTAFRVEAGGLNRVMDVLSVTFTSSNVSMEQLAQSMKFVAPVASAMGHSIEETAASIGKLGDAGIQAGMAGTYLRSMLGELGRPSGRIQKQFDRLGISTRNLEGDIRSAVEYIEEYERIGAEATLGYTIHGRRGGTPAVLLASEGAESIRRLEAQTRAGFAETEKIAKTMLDHLNADIAILFSKWQTFLNKIAKSGPMALSRTVVQRLQGMMDGMNEMSAESLKWKVTLAAAAAILIPMLTVVSALVLRFSEMRANILAARDMRAMKDMKALAEAERKRAQDARVWASEKKKSLVMERTLARDNALKEQRITKDVLNTHLAAQGKKEKAFDKAHQKFVAAQQEDRKQAVAMLRAETKATNRLAKAQDKVYGSKVAKKVSGLTPDQLAKTNRDLRKSLDLRKGLTKEINKQQSALQRIWTSEKSIAKRQVEAAPVRNQVALLKAQGKELDKQIDRQAAAARTHRNNLGELRAARKELKLARSGEVTAAKNLNVQESKATKAAREKLQVASKNLALAQADTRASAQAHKEKSAALTTSRRSLQVAKAQSIQIMAQQRLDQSRAELNKQVLRDQNKASTQVARASSGLAPGAVALQRMATWGKSFVATLFGAAGMIVGLGLVLGALGKITKMGVERAFKKSEIAAMDYAKALREIAKIEKEQRDGAVKNMRYTQTYGATGYAESNQKTWQDEQLDLLRDRLGIAQLQAIKSEWADELNSYHKLIRDDLSKMRSGDINFQQWESGIKTTAEEIDNLEEKAMMFAKRFPEAVTNYEEAFALVRGELQQTTALMKTLQAYSEPLEEVGRALNALQYNKIPSDEITKSAALAELDDLSKKLDAVELHMESTGASTEEFASEFEILRERIETTRMDTELLTKAYEDQAEVIRIMPELPEPDTDFFSDFAREAQDAIMLIEDVQKSMWLDNPAGRSIFDATAMFDQRMLDDAEKAMKDSLKDLQDRLAAPFADFGSKMGQNFARAFLRRDEGDSIVSLLKDALFASTLQRAVESIGAELGKRFALQFGAQITKAKALWTAAMKSSLLAPITAAVAGVAYIVKTALSRGDQSDAERAAINHAKAIEVVNEATERRLELMREEQERLEELIDWWERYIETNEEWWNQVRDDRKQETIDALAVAEEEQRRAEEARAAANAAAGAAAEASGGPEAAAALALAERAAQLADEAERLAAAAQARAEFLVEHLAQMGITLEEAVETAGTLAEQAADLAEQAEEIAQRERDRIEALAEAEQDRLDDLADQFTELADAMIDVGEATDEFLAFVASTPELAAFGDQIEELTGNIEALADAQENLDNVNAIRSGISGLLPDSDIEKLSKYGEITDDLRSDLLAAGGDDSLLDALAMRIRALRDYEAAVEDFKRTGTASQLLRDAVSGAGFDAGLFDDLEASKRAIEQFEEAAEIFSRTGVATDELHYALMELADTDLRGLLGQIASLESRMESLQEKISFLGELSSSLGSLLPKSGIQLLLDEGLVDDALLKQLRESGVDLTLIENLSQAVKNLRAFEESLSDQTVDEDLDDLSDSAEEASKSLDLLQELQRGLEDYLPTSAPMALLHDFFQSGRLPTKLLSELVAAGVPQELIATFSMARSDLLDFYKEAQDQRWRDEFAFEEREYELVRQQEEAALALHLAVSDITQDLEAHTESNNQHFSDVRDGLDEAAQAERDALEAAVEQTAQALFDSVTGLKENLQEELEASRELHDALNQKLEDAIEAAREALSEAHEALVEQLDEVLEATTEVLTEGVEKAAAAFDESLKALAESLTTTINSLTSAIRDLIKAIADLLAGKNAVGGGGADKGTYTDRHGNDVPITGTNYKGSGNTNEEWECREKGGLPVKNADGDMISCYIPTGPDDPHLNDAPTTTTETPTGLTPEQIQDQLDRDTVDLQQKNDAACVNRGWSGWDASTGACYGYVGDTEPEKEIPKPEVTPPTPPDPPPPDPPTVEPTPIPSLISQIINAHKEQEAQNSPVVNIQVDGGRGAPDDVVNQIVKAVEENRGRIRDTLRDGF